MDGVKRKEDYIKFRIKVNDEEYDSHIAYNKLLDFVEEQMMLMELVSSLFPSLSESRVQSVVPRLLVQP